MNRAEVAGRLRHVLAIGVTLGWLTGWVPCAQAQELVEPEGGLDASELEADEDLPGLDETAQWAPLEDELFGVPGTDVATAQTDTGTFRGVDLRLATTLAYTDNVLRTDDNTKSAFVTRFQPAAAWRYSYGKHNLQLGYEGDYGVHSNVSREDYDDHNVSAQLTLDLTRRLTVNWRGGVKFGHVPRSSEIARLNRNDKPDQWTERRVLGEVVYGRRVAQAQLVGSVERAQKRFTSNNQSFRNFDAWLLTGRAYWNLGPKSSVFVEGDHAIFDYDEPSSPLDSTETGGFVGLRWEATVKTEGEVKFGYTTKDLDDSDQNDFSGTSWDGQVLWRPKPFTTWRAFTSRRNEEGIDAGVSFLTSSRVGLELRHEFTNRIALESGVEYGRTKFSNLDTSNRRDKIWEGRAEVIYDFRRWLRLGLGYRHLRRDSNVSDANYRDNTAFFRVIASYELFGSDQSAAR